uniref:BTB domain-containing protein n=1 Tax=Panagrolaimus sp. PS1159 TaxID=55785 RepID=A0AC35GKU8_9BILA
MKLLLLLLSFFFQLFSQKVSAKQFVSCFPTKNGNGAKCFHLLKTDINDKFNYADAIEICNDPTNVYGAEINANLPEPSNDEELTTLRKLLYWQNINEPIYVQSFYGNEKLKEFYQEFLIGTAGGKNMDAMIYDWKTNEIKFTDGNAKLPVLCQTVRFSTPVSAEITDNSIVEKEEYKPESVQEASPLPTCTKRNHADTHPPSYPSSTVQQSELYTILANTKYHDVTLLASDGMKIPAHRSILSYYSPGFTQIFEKSTEFPVQIEMKDFDGDVIKAALDYMLFKPDSIGGKKLALFKFAAKYNIPKLMESCAVNADKLEITKSNVTVYVQIAYDYNLEELKEKCLKFLAENKKEIDVDLWNELPKNILVDLIGVLHY